MHAPFQPQLYLAYASTLSTNATLLPMPGGHDFPWVSAGATAGAMLSKFAGV